MNIQDWYIILFTIYVYNYRVYMPSLKIAISYTLLDSNLTEREEKETGVWTYVRLDLHVFIDFWTQTLEGNTFLAWQQSFSQS